MTSFPPIAACILITSAAGWLATCYDVMAACILITSVPIWGGGNLLMDDFQKNQITNLRNGRRTYLVTYSQADLKKFPTRESFGTMLEAKFNAGPGKARVSHWACCLEEHQEGGFH